MLTEPIAVTLLVIDALVYLQVPYFIAGSLASALHGVARATMDVDLVADMQLEHVEPFIQHLGDAFYTDAEMILSAVQHHTSFNLIHQETIFKVDIFLPKKRPYNQMQFERRILITLVDDPQRSAYFASPEDNILAKLEWYRMGGEVSDRQWGDVINVIKIQGDRLDVNYLHRWSIELEVNDLMMRALLQAKPSD